LKAKELSAKDINKEILPVYGGKCLSHLAVHNWVEKFSQYRLKVTDDARTSFPVDITTEATLKRVES
jgi:hypothetical protein